MAPECLLVTGGNRGIGLELVRQFLASSHPPKHIFATYRSPSTSAELLELAKTSPSLHPIHLDLSDTSVYPALVTQIAETVGKAGLNLLINNAGIMPSREDLYSVTPEDMMEAFKINCVVPLFLAKALLPLLQMAADRMPGNGLGIDRAAIVQMSSCVASIANAGGLGGDGTGDGDVAGGMYPYRCSKAALNMGMKSMSVDLKDKGILVVALHPGWVKTDMGGPAALISTQTSVSAILDTLGQLSEEDNGSFLTFDKKSLPW